MLYRRLVLNFRNLPEAALDQGTFYIRRTPLETMKTPRQPQLDIAWATDEELAWLLTQPELCRHLFGQKALLRELFSLIQCRPRDAYWYRPAYVSLNGHWAAAGGFKGPPQVGSVEIGYRVHPAFRRRGLASALAQWLCKAAADQGVKQVVAVTVNNNRASQRVLAQNGFIHTGDLLSDSQRWLQRWQYRIQASTAVRPPVCDRRSL